MNRIGSLKDRKEDFAVGPSRVCEDVSGAEDGACVSGFGRWVDGTFWEREPVSAGVVLSWGFEVLSWHTWADHSSPNVCV